MIYLAWAALYEGAVDQAYFDVLIPRVIEDILLDRGIGKSTIPATPAVRFKRASVAEVAEEACNSKDAFYITFIHADTGGRALASGLAARSQAYCEQMQELCNLPPVRCVSITPKHETEAWMLADAGAVMGALGYKGRAEDLELPITAAAAERLGDPKSTLAFAMDKVRGRRGALNVEQLVAAIAQRQSVNELRKSASFRSCEEALVAALKDLGCVER